MPFFEGFSRTLAKIFSCVFHLSKSRGNSLETFSTKFCQAPGPGLDQPGPRPCQPGHQLGHIKPWPTSSPNWPNLALTLTKCGPGVDTIIKQTTITTTPTHQKTFQSQKLEDFSSLTALTLTKFGPGV